MKTFDRSDRKILEILQGNSNVTNLALAEQVGLSPAACLRRVRMLRDSGVIQRDVSLVDPVTMGKRLTALVEVTLARHSAGFHAEFQQRVLAEPAITQCYLVSGETDALLVINIEDMEAYEALANRMFDTYEQIVRYRTLFSIRRVKFQTAVEVSEQ